MTHRYDPSRHREYKSAAYRLWYFRYPVLIPESYRYMPAYMESVGYAVTGDQDLDQLKLDAMATVNQTPVGCAVLHGQGAPVIPTTPQDAALVYHDIREHLTMWFYEVQHGLVVNDRLLQVLEDLRALEAFAIHLHDLAQRHRPYRPQISLFRERLQELNHNRAGALDDNFTEIKRRAPQEIEAYQALVPDIERQLLET